MQVTWSDRSDNEDTFHVFRNDVDGSIGSTPANTQIFLDGDVSCGNTYHYLVVALNAAGSSTATSAAKVSMPPCAAPDEPPVLSLTVVPTQVHASETLTITFVATDDLSLELSLIHI